MYRKSRGYAANQPRSHGLKVVLLLVLLGAAAAGWFFLWPDRSAAVAPLIREIATTHKPCSLPGARRCPSRKRFRCRCTRPSWRGRADADHQGRSHRLGREERARNSHHSHDVQPLARTLPSAVGTSLEPGTDGELAKMVLSSRCTSTTPARRACSIGWSTPKT